MIRTPVASCTACQTVAGSVLAGGHRPPQPASRSALPAAMHRPVGGGRGEQHRDAVLGERVGELLGVSRSSSTVLAPARSGNTTSPPSPKVNAIGGVPVTTSSGRDADDVPGERVGDGQHVAVQVHRRLGPAGGAGGEGEQGDVVGRGGDRGERPLGRAARTVGELGVAGVGRRWAGPGRSSVWPWWHSASAGRASSVIGSARPRRSIGMVVTATPPASSTPSQQATSHGSFGPRSSTRLPGTTSEVLDEHGGDLVGAARAGRRRSRPRRSRARRAGRPPARSSSSAAALSRSG